MCYEYLIDYTTFIEIQTPLYLLEEVQCHKPIPLHLYATMTLIQLNKAIYMIIMFHHKKKSFKCYFRS